MNATVPYSLDSGMLARRLGELVGHERTVQVDFLLHLDEFDRRRAYLELGFGSLRVTIDSACKEELETLKALLSHKVPDGDLASVLREAIRCGVEKHGKRKGATPPARKRQAKVEAAEPRNRIPAAVNAASAHPRAGAALLI